MAVVSGDQFGHQVGDRVLQDFASAVGDSLRETDELIGELAARGEAFLDDLSLRLAVAVAAQVATAPLVALMP